TGIGLPRMCDGLERSSAATSGRLRRSVLLVVLTRHGRVSGGATRHRTGQERRKIRFLRLPFLPQAADDPHFQIGSELERDVAADLVLANLRTKAHGPRSSVDGYEASIAHAVLSNRWVAGTTPRKLTLSRRQTPRSRGCARNCSSMKTSHQRAGTNLATACTTAPWLPLTRCRYVSFRDLEFILLTTFASKS